VVVPLPCRGASSSTVPRRRAPGHRCDRILVAGRLCCGSSRAGPISR
jgi:hypothetical protein